MTQFDTFEIIKSKSGYLKPELEPFISLEAFVYAKADKLTQIDAYTTASLILDNMTLFSTEPLNFRLILDLYSMYDYMYYTCRYTNAQGIKIYGDIRLITDFKYRAYDIVREYAKKYANTLFI